MTLVRVTWQEFINGLWVDRGVTGSSKIGGPSDQAKADIIAYLSGPGRPPYRDLNFHGGK